MAYCAYMQYNLYTALAPKYLKEDVFACSQVNLLLAPFYVVSHWINQTPESPREGILFAMIGEVVAVSLMILVITNLDTKEHDSAIATLELAEKVREVEAAEREGGAAQRLLAVTCDAFVPC